jgi:uncharacterized protein YraI
MTHHRARRAALAAAAATATFAATLTVATPAHAAGSGCYYPQVCLYPSSQTTRPTGRFRDVTSGWQWLSRSFGDKSVYNTRHHTVAYLLTTTGRTICVPPRTRAGLMNGGFTAIRISPRSHC